MKKINIIAAITRLLPKRWQTRTPNVFGMLIAVAGAAIALRLVNIAAYTVEIRDGDLTPPPGMTRSATAQDAAKPAPASLSDEDAPPLTQGDINRNVRDSATAPADTTQLAQNNAATPATAPAAGAAPAENAPVIREEPPVNEDGTRAAPLLGPTDGREYSESELDILQSLSKRREDLDQRERNLNESAAMLKAAEKEVDRKLAELNTLKAEIEKLLGQQSQMEDQRITSLVKIYEAMKPKEAATIFNTLDPDVLLSVVSRMNERRLSPILASMDPEKARMVTIRLAEMRQLPGSAAASTPKGAPAPADEPESPELDLPDVLPTP